MLTASYFMLRDQVLQNLGAKHFDRHDTGKTIGRLVRRLQISDARWKSRARLSAGKGLLSSTDHGQHDPPRPLPPSTERLPESQETSTRASPREPHPRQLNSAGKDSLSRSGWLAADRR